MAISAPFSIRLFVADGDPDGLRIVERSNWNGLCLMFPRTVLPEIRSRGEFARAGVYLLLGPRKDAEGEMLYIGEGDPVGPRLESHYSKKDFWNRGIFFVTGSAGALNKAHVKYIEARLIEMALAAKRIKLDNQNSPSLPTLNEADQADMEVFLSHMLQILPLLGIDAFEQAKAAPPSERLDLLIVAKGVRGHGYESKSGFVVCAGSEVVMETTASMKKHLSGIMDLRSDLIERGVIDGSTKPYRFSMDYVFSSPSTAAAVILGRSANGRTEWRDKAGRTLKHLQSAKAGTVS